MKGISKYTTLPALPKIADAMPALPSEPVIAVGAPDAAQTASTFEDRWNQWGKGSRPVFVIVDFLSIKQVPYNWDGAYRFDLPGGLIWRVNDQLAPNKAASSIEKMMLQQQGYRVEDFDANSLVPGEAQRMLGASLAR